ncbi:mothers against decapentaplegic homolog 4-like isoform X2 [Paramacrobiotus metropolitanus]|uniref:mothers against decapentaplegic homolog 4-like isoform X2 n=1 Tax=Paramacrobiotus metropolitanus TaxID=2943436 RepID=UPI002445FCA9|nr:mothers against decapentaplegic homolog 4-like isoform X2 [Paramacrobiotus metropolitanus]
MLEKQENVAGKKVFPHVIYARIWRWHDIQKSELKNIDYCQFAFDRKLDSVCVNPYHYERVISPGIDLNLAGLGLQDHRDDQLYDYDNGLPPMVPSRGFMHGIPQPELHPMLAPPTMSAMENRPNCNLVHNGVMPDFNGYEQKPQIHGLFPSMGPDAVFIRDNQQPSTSTGYWEREEPNPPGPMPNPELGDPGAPFIQLEKDQWEQRKFQMALTSQPPPDYWCNIAYFELDRQVGETFKVRHACKTVTIDGFSNPDHVSRFCLGSLTNVHREDPNIGEKIVRCRLHIGHGVSLEYRDDDGIWLRVLGSGGEENYNNYSVFVQSYLLDRNVRIQLQDRISPGDAVHKIHPYSQVLKIFDLRYCYSQMLEQLERTQLMAHAQVAAVTGHRQPNSLSPVPPITMGSSTGIGADDLRKFCVLRLSFLKGWGPDYQRKTIKETPCWVEIHVNRALQLLDDVLRSAPSNEPRTMTEYP